MAGMHACQVPFIGFPGNTFLTTPTHEPVHPHNQMGTVIHPAPNLPQTGTGTYTGTYTGTAQVHCQPQNQGAGTSGTHSLPDSAHPLAYFSTTFIQSLIRHTQWLVSNHIHSAPDSPHTTHSALEVPAPGSAALVRFASTTET